MFRLEALGFSVESMFQHQNCRGSACVCCISLSMYSALQLHCMCCSMLQCVAVCCRCVAVCCSVLQCVAVCCSAS